MNASALFRKAGDAKLGPEHDNLGISENGSKQIDRERRYRYFAVRARCRSAALPICQASKAAMDDLILNDVNPSLELVRRWAYDENLSFIEQDEDLILHDSQYFPMLLELAREPECPKNDYCMSIVYYCSQLNLLWRARQPCDVLFQCIDSEIRNSPVTKKWAKRYSDAYERFVNPRAMSHDEAVELANWLLVGDYCHRSFADTGCVIDGFHEFVSFTSSYKGYLYINLQTGIWQQSRHTPLTALKL